MILHYNHRNEYLSPALTVSLPDTSVSSTARCFTPAHPAGVTHSLLQTATTGTPRKHLFLRYDPNLETSLMPIASHSLPESNTRVATFNHATPIPTDFNVSPSLLAALLAPSFTRSLQPQPDLKCKLLAVRSGLLNLNPATLP